MNRSAAIVLAAALLCSCSRDGLDQLAPGETGKVAQIRSGDTFVLQDGLVVRLVGIDAPNRSEPYAPEARAALEGFADGAEVHLYYGGARRDKYNRALAHVRLKANGAWLQQRLLEAGAARVRTYPDNRAMARQMLAFEDKARTSRRGLWALGDYRVRLPIETRLTSGFQIIEGRVTTVTAEGPDVSIEMDGLVRGDIPAGRLADFRNAQLDPDHFEGRLIRIRGLLRHGGSVRLDHPEQIERLDETKNARP